MNVPAAAAPGPRTPAPAPRHVLGSGEGRRRTWHRFIESRSRLTTGVLLACLAVCTLLVGFYPETVSWVVFVPFVVLSGTLHEPRRHAFVLGAGVLGMVTASVLTGHTKRDWALAVAGLCAVGAITLWRSVVRARVGVQGSRGEEMLVDLRTMLLDRGRLPHLPGPWHAETCVESAYAHRFSGDFVVVRRTRGDRFLEIVLVDVSGKGLDAGSRALSLSGAFDALLGSVPVADFLAAANDYVARQEWSEGFATAVHVALDLETGEYTLGRAGHPPAIVFAAREGGPTGWAAREEGAGPALGLVPALTYPLIRGRLDPGEGLVLYTDGLVEDRSCDVDAGVRHLVDTLGRHSASGFGALAGSLCAGAAAGAGDDRGVVVLWRD